MKYFNNTNNEAGFSLIELLVALAILHIGIAALYLAHGITQKAKTKYADLEKIRIEILNTQEWILLNQSQPIDSTWVKQFHQCEIEFKATTLDENFYRQSRTYYDEDQLNWLSQKAPEIKISTKALNEHCLATDSIWFILERPLKKADIYE